MATGVRDPETSLNAGLGCSGASGHVNGFAESIRHTCKPNSVPGPIGPAVAIERLPRVITGLASVGHCIAAVSLSNVVSM